MTLKHPATIILAVSLITVPGLFGQQSVVDGADIIVAQDGSGQFRTIQAALDAIPAQNSRHVTILVKNGIYNEKLYITKSYLAIVGEHRDSTRVVYAELRSNWTKASNTRTVEAAQHDDWGAAVVNVGNGVTDISFANLTIHNNYGTLYGNNEHQFAIRGFNATRIAILYCTVRADGGDTVSLWNGESGMYYHSNCTFEGWVDYVCPRGWCYITDSKFYGHNLSASLWHDGSGSKDQKFVIRNSRFDGVQGFPLGRHHRDAQFYLLDCVFSKNMADRRIYSPKSPNVRPWVWGARQYYYNCRREGGDYSWFADNLQEAEDAPRSEEITAAWTFGGKWDPESTLPAILPFTSLPQPRNAEYGVTMSSITLKWLPGRNANEHRVYFGETNPPPFAGTQHQASFLVKSLQHSTTYYWKVDEVTASGIIPGEVWKFSTASETVGQQGL